MGTIKRDKAVWVVLDQEVEDGDAENGPSPNGPSIYYVPVRSFASHKKASRYAYQNKMRFHKIDCLRKNEIGNTEWR